MRTQIRRLPDTRRNLAAWDAYVRNHGLGHGYQLSAYQTAVHGAYGFKPLRFAAVSGASRRVAGIFPLVHVHRPFSGGSLVSLPYCDAGGPLADTPELEASLLAHALKFARDRGIPVVHVRSVRPFAGIDPEQTKNAQKVRMLLSLPSCPKALLASFKAKVRSQVKKPLKDGLKAQMGGKELVEPFYRVFRENMRDLGSPVHSRDWIFQILHAYRNRAHIGLARLPTGEPAAGGIILCHPKTVSIPWASSLRRFNRLNPNMLLYWQFLAFAAAHKFEFFDFGRSTPGEGTYRFKKQWGSRQTHLHWADFDASSYTGGLPDPLPRDLSLGGSGLRDTAEVILSRMPVPWLTWLGSHTRKYITL